MLVLPATQCSSSPHSSTHCALNAANSRDVLNASCSCPPETSAVLPSTPDSPSSTTALRSGISTISGFAHIVENHTVRRAKQLVQTFGTCFTILKVAVDQERHSRGVDHNLRPYWDPPPSEDRASVRRGDPTIQPLMHAQSGHTKLYRLGRRGPI